MMISKISTGINQNFKGEFNIQKFQNLVNYTNNTAIVHTIVEYRPYLHDTNEIQAKEKEDYTKWTQEQKTIIIGGKEYRCLSCCCTIYDGPRLNYDKGGDCLISIAKSTKSLNQQNKGNGNNSKGVK